MTSTFSLTLLLLPWASRAVHVSGEALGPQSGHAGSYWGDESKFALGERGDGDKTSGKATRPRGAKALPGEYLEMVIMEQGPQCKASPICSFSEVALQAQGWGYVSARAWSTRSPHAR